MTDALLYPGLTLTLGVDGERPVHTYDSDGCCTDPICSTETERACGIVDLLPSGPMWDRQKFEVKQQIVANGGVPATGFDCPSMVTYAVYLGQVMTDAAQNIIYPAIRESQPHTAVDTLDDWLERLNWVDCYRSQCRSEYLSVLSPYEYDAACGSEYFPTAYSTDFENALKHGILRSLIRAQRGVIKNLAGINWVIEPLGAALSPQLPYPDVVQDYVDASATNDPYTYLPGFVDECESCFCGEVQLEICNTGTELPLAPTADSFCDNEPMTIAAEQTYVDGDGNNVQLFPGVIAAECIARTMLPRPCPNIINRC